MSFAAYTIFYIRFNSTLFYFICSYYKVPKLAFFFSFNFSLISITIVQYILYVL